MGTIENGMEGPHDLKKELWKDPAGELQNTDQRNWNLDFKEVYVSFVNGSIVYNSQHVDTT